LAKVLAKCDFGACVLQETDDIRRCPGDGEQHADQEHGLNDLGLSLTGAGRG